MLQGNPTAPQPNQQPLQQPVSPAAPPPSTATAPPPSSMQPVETAYNREQKGGSGRFLWFLIWMITVIIAGVGSVLVYIALQNAGKTGLVMCVYNGNQYTEGESFDATDGCNTCNCENGVVACTEKDCNGTNPSPTPSLSPTEVPVVKSETECTKLDGQWGVFGLLKEEQCNLPAGDAGEQCVDGSECEGECIAEHITLETSEQLPIETTGLCSENLLNFGCHAFVKNGVVDGVICVD
ncbi:MAG: hypothetical protein ACE5DX_03415 [Candidatus Dojkabacteria bacterium]